MARLRRPAPPKVRDEAVPDHLARCVVEDWVAPDEIPPHLPTTVNSRAPGADYIADARLILAWRRHHRALVAWLAEHLTAERPPYSRPTWRSQ